MRFRDSGNLFKLQHSFCSTKPMESIMTSLYSLISRRLFHPGPLDWIFNPVYLIRRPIYRALGEMAKDVSGFVLDFGCGSMPYKEMFLRAEQYVGVDLAQSPHGLSNPDLVLVDGIIPFPDQSFDWVLMFEVLDDLQDPKEQLDEIFRVLKPGGRLLSSSSLVWEIHEEPNDFYRYTNYGISFVFQESGFENVEVKRLGSYQAVVGQLVAMYWYQTLRRIPVLGVVVAAPIVGVANGITLLLQRILPNRAELYLTNLFTASRPI